MIRKLMASRAIRGNPENYVVIIGSELIDCSGSYSAVLSEGGKVFGDTVALVHKRDLAKVIGEEAALRFWEPGVGRVDGASQPDPDLPAVGDGDGTEPEQEGGDDAGDTEGAGEPDA